MPLFAPDLVTADHTFAIFLAVVGAALLAIGTHAQHSAVNGLPQNSPRPRIAAGSPGAHAAAGSPGAHAAAGSPDAHSAPRSLALRRLLVTPLWWVGGTLIVLETILNVAALALAPVALIQPLGTVSLVVAVLIGAVAARSSISHESMGAVVLVVASVTVFVSTASRHMEVSPASNSAAAVLAAGLLTLSLVGVFVARSRTGHTIRVAAAGVLFGGVASGAHVAGVLVLAGEGFPPAAWVVVAALAPASAVGIWLVQTAYANGSAESVLAGLTVVDPIAAVLIGGVVLGEFGAIPPGTVAVLGLSGVGALWGVKILARYRPGILPTPASPVMSAPADNMGGARGEGVPAHP